MTMRSVLLLPILVVAALLFGCDRSSVREDLSLTDTVTIASLHDRPEESLGQVVRLQGEVTTVVPFAQQRAFLLEDESGQVWVLAPSEGPPPTPGTDLKLEGRVAVERVPNSVGEEIVEVYVRQQQQP